MSEFIKRTFKLTPNIQVLVTGVFAWVLLSFSSLKLSLIYAPKPLLAYVLTYNIIAIVYLLYFYGYLKPKFNFIMLMLLFFLYNFGIYFFEFLYIEFIMVYKSSMDIMLKSVNMFINFLIMVITYLVVKKIVK